MVIILLVEYKDGKKYAKSNADICNDINTFNDCGIQLQRDDVVIDIDDATKPIIKEIIDYFEIKTQTVWTDRGVHFYYKKPEGLKKCTTGACALGIKVEMKTSSNTGDITIKRNGVARKMENVGVYETLPDFFIASPKRYKNLLGMDVGEGRNSALFSHKMAMNNMDGWENILYFINKHLFATPLDDSEFQNVARSQSTNSNNTSQYDIAQTIMNDYRCVKYIGSLYWLSGRTYEDGKVANYGEYISDAKNERLRRVVYKVCGEVNTRYIDEVIKQIEYRSRILSNDTAFPIRFNNGVLMPNGRFLNIVYEDFTPYHIDVDYKESAKPVQIVDDYINNLTDHDEDYKSFLLEAWGYSLITDPEIIRTLGKFFIFRGSGANGKGTMLQVMKRILNPKNCTSLNIKQLADYRYNITMIGALANLGDDIEGDAIDNKQMKMLKNIATADTISLRHLYQESENATLTTKLYFTTNSNIKSYEKGYAYQRRVVWLPMFNTFKNPDPKIISKLTTREALEYWIKLWMEGYQRLMTNGSWTKSQKLEKYNEDYHLKNNSMLEFVNALTEDGTIETVIIGKTITQVREAFEKSGRQENAQSFSPKQLKEALRNHKDKKGKADPIGRANKKIEGVSTKVFLRPTDTKQELDYE